MGTMHGTVHVEDSSQATPNMIELQNKIDMLEAQLKKAHVLSDEQNQQIVWIN